METGIHFIIQELENVQNVRNVTTTSSMVSSGTGPHTGITVTTGIYSICKCSAITALSYAGRDFSSHTFICNR